MPGSCCVECEAQHSKQAGRQTPKCGHTIETLNPPACPHSLHALTACSKFPAHLSGRLRLTYTTCPPTCYLALTAVTEATPLPLHCCCLPASQPKAGPGTTERSATPLPPIHRPVPPVVPIPIPVAAPAASAAAVCQPLCSLPGLLLTLLLHQAQSKRRKVRTHQSAGRSGHQWQMRRDPSASHCRKVKKRVSESGGPKCTSRRRRSVYILKAKRGSSRLEMRSRT